MGKGKNFFIIYNKSDTRPDTGERSGGKASAVKAEHLGYPVSEDRLYLPRKNGSYPFGA